MTLPDERYRAVISAYEFLTDLIVPQRTPGLPSAIRHRAQSVLRHYPSAFDMSMAATSAPHVFQERMDPLVKMVQQYEDDSYPDERICNDCWHKKFKGL
jgi:hypothetical protein